MRSSRLVGRGAERELLAVAAAGAALGEPSGVVVHGEPGVGKTRLVADAVSALASSHNVLWARFPRFSSEATAFLPVAQALSRWSATASHADRAAAFADADDLAAILPELGPMRPVDGGRLTAMLTTVLYRIGRLRPVVLVADDLQWADASSLDFLAYVIAGFGPNQYLTILGTYRDTEVGAGHRFIEWIADMRRMPRVTVRSIDRLDRVETADLVRELTAGAGTGLDSPDPEAIYMRSLGNPYLTQLLVADPGMDGRTIEEALLASWHRLDAEARTLAQILAIGGLPVPLGVLDAVAKRSGLKRRAVDRAMASAELAGLAEVHADRVWFRHPLVSEVIAGTVPTAVAGAWHADYVRVLARGADLPEHARAALLALHHDAAGHTDDAFAWSIRAAGAAAAMRATAEESGHLQRAVRLWDDVSGEVRASVGDRVALLERASLAALCAGQFGVAQALAREAVRLVDRVVQPLRLVRLLLTLPLYCEHGATYEEDLALKREAYELAVPHGQTVELALALSYLSDAELWNGIDGAKERAKLAVAVADALGSPAAAARAHLVHSQFHWSEAQGADEALAAWMDLRLHSDVVEWGRTSLMVMNCLAGVGQFDALVAHALRSLADLTAFGAAAIGAVQATAAAGFLVRLGRWPEAHEVLRNATANGLNRQWGAEARGTAAVLAVHEGDLEAARNHLARARELSPGTEPRGLALAVVQVQFLWACGRLEEAVEEALSEMSLVPAADREKAEELYLWGTRSIADLAETDHPQTRSSPAPSHLTQLDAVRRTGPAREAQPAFQDNIHAATLAIIAAERARCLSTPDQVDLWRAARDAGTQANLVWESGWAAYQVGLALLRQRGHRPEAAETLRTAYETATLLGAKPLAERILVVAAQAHIPLRGPGAQRGPTMERAAEAAYGLTAREAEVLAEIVTGRTYAEISRALFISEKTVSVHVSNMLRKTGKTSRVDLAMLVANSPKPNGTSAATGEPAGPAVGQ